MANYVVSDTSLGSVADAIRTKGGTSAPLTYPQGFIDAIDDIQTGGGSAVIQSLSVTQNGTYTAPSGVDGYSPVTVNVSGGDTPIPADGRTRIWIHIADGTPDNRLTFYLRFTASVAKNTMVDWGDGTSEVKGSTSATSYSHKYSSGGDYVITMTVNSGTISFIGTSGGNGYSIYGARAASNNNYHNRSRIQKVIIGENVTTIGAYAFYNCYSLESITISDSVTDIGTYAFQYCYNLTSITISDSVTSIGAYAFNSCHGFTTVTIPDGVTSIGASAFATSFGSVYGVSEYHFKSTIPPTLANTDVFSNNASDRIFYVPYSADHSILDAYKTATNWSTYASYMQEEPT